MSSEDMMDAYRRGRSEAYFDFIVYLEEADYRKRMNPWHNKIANDSYRTALRNAKRWADKKVRADA